MKSISQTNVGRWRDDEVSCQYHYKPSDYFNENPDVLPQKDFELKRTITPKQLAPKPISYIDKGIVGRTLSNYNINPMFKYLTGLFGNEETIRIFDIYRLAQPRNGEVPLSIGRLTTIVM